MNKQIIAIFLTLLMIGTIFVIAPSDLQVGASGGGGDNGFGLDYSYIYNKTKALSDIIKTEYEPGELAKGRAFGTEGEHAAADYIEGWMNNLSLYNVHQDKMEDKWFLGKALFDFDKITEKHEVLARRCIFNNTVDSNLTREVDCYIKPIENYNKTYCNTSYNGLRIKPKNYTDHSGFVEYVIDDVEDDFDIFGSQSLVDFLKPHFEEYYGFEFDEIDPDNQSTFPSFVDKYPNVTYNFVTLEENTGFNPDMDPDENILKLRPLYWRAREVVDFLEDLTYEDCYINVAQNEPYRVGKIKYDYTSESHDNIVRNPPEKPVIFINGSDGSILNSSLSDYRIDFDINQTYNPKVESYNVIGVINGTNNDRTVIISSLYDSVWSQGTADSAIGMSIVLAIAKYFKDNGITPKYKIKFIAFGGEEYGYRGAYYYRTTHRPENIDTVIDLNQLGFSQSGPGDPECIQHVITNNLNTRNSLNDIVSVTDFEARTGTEIDTLWILTGSLSNDFVFATRPLKKPKTILFLKDFGWYRHHRDGQNHNEGDSILYYDDDEVKVVAEMIWNVTKYFTINPDCSFEEGYPTYWAFDNTSYDNNDDPDTVRINFSISTIMPIDRIRVDASLQTIYDSGDNPPHDGPIPDSGNTIVSDIPLFVTPDSGPDGVLCSTTYSYNYITGPQRTSICDGDITVKNRINNSGPILPDRNDSFQLFSDNCHYVNNFVRNSTKDWGDHNLITNSPPPSNRIEKYYIINQSGITDSINITIKDYSPNATYEIKLEVFNSTGIIDEEPQLEWSAETNLSPNNDISSGLDSMTISSNTILLMVDVEENTLQTGLIDLIVNASDPNSDDIEIQAVFINTSGKIQFTNWTRPLAQGVNHTEQFTWTLPDVTEVRVRTRDIKRSHNQMSSWSDPLNITLNATCQACISPLIEIPNENITFKGLQYSIDNITSWEWDFDDDTTNSSQNTTHSFNQTGSYQITLNVTDNQSNVYTNNTTITILYIISDFNMSKDSVKINESITFTNTSKSYYNNITNLTWDFGDGAVIYENNTPVHNYSSEGVYNVSFTVTDNQSHNHTVKYSPA